MAVPEPANQDLRRGQQQPGHGELNDQPARRLLQARGRLRGGGQRLADAAHGRGGAGGTHPRQPHTLGDHSAGEQVGRAVAAGRGGGARVGGLGRRRRRKRVRGRRQLVHRNGFAGQQRFVHGQLALHQQGVGRDPVAFVQHQQVAAHHVATGDARLRAVAEDQRARRREVAQGFQRALRLALLRQRDADHHEHKGQQQRGFGAVAQQQVDAAGHQQHQEHRLGEHAAHHVPQRARGAAGQQVGAVTGQPGRGVRHAESDRLRAFLRGLTGPGWSGGFRHPVPPRAGAGAGV